MNTNLQQLKQVVNQVSFPENISHELNSILDKGIQKGNLDTSEEEKLMNIIETELAQTELEAEMYQQVAEAAEEFLDKSAQEIKTVENATQATEDSISSIKKVVQQ